MKPIFIMFLMLLFMIDYLRNQTEASYTNFVVKRFEICNKTQRQVKYYAHITTENGKQYLTHNVTYPYSMGDNIEFVCLIETKIVGNMFLELFTIREKNICKAFNKYMGEFWYAIERQSLMAPKVCPGQQGVYHGNHILLDYERISLQTFPFGTLRLTMNGINHSNKESVWCISIEMDNIAN